MPEQFGHCGNGQSWRILLKIIEGDKMALKTKAQLAAELAASYADNTNGDITPADLRTQQQNMIDSLLALNETASQTVAGPVNFTGGLTENGLNVTYDNTVIVNEAADFPAAVANVRTLAASTTYVITGAIDIGADRLVLGLNCKILGVDSQICSITSTTTGALFTATQNFILDNFKVTVTSGTVFACTGSAFESAYLSRFTVNSCTSLGTFTTWYSLFWEKGAVVSGGTGLSFSGACNVLILDLVEFVIWNNSGTAVNLGTATFSTCSIIRCGFQGLGGTGQTGVNLAASSANINAGKLGRLTSNTFSTALATPVANLSAADLRWNSELNTNLLTTERQGQGYITGSALNTTFGATGVGNEVLVNFGTAFVADIQNQFTVSNAGRFTYNGIFSESFYFAATMYATITGGSARSYVFFIAKNGTIIDSSGAKNQYDGTNPGSCSVGTILSLVTGDYIEIMVRAVTATTSLNVDTASARIFGH